MANLQSSINDKTNGFQKVIAFGLLAAVGYGVVKLLNNVLPSINELLSNIWTLLMYGVPLAIIVLYVASNPMFIWGLFKTLSYKLTAFLVKMDPLSVMDRYVEYLRKKLTSLGETITVLRGKKNKLDREIATREANIRENTKLGKASIKVGDNKQAGLYGIKIQSDQSTVDNLKPLQIRAQKSLDFMVELEENWGYAIEKLEYQIAGKRSEYEIIKETTKGLKTADDLINSDNEAARLYGMSVKALEEQVTQQLGYIDEFERKSKDVMSSMKIEKQSNQDEGLAIIEEYMKDDKVKLDFSGAESIPFEDVPGSMNAPTAKKFNLLNNKK